MKELSKQYDPKKVEDEIYAAWEKSGYFSPDNLEGEPYSIMMPPPNVTGVLHLGHAWENSLMDIMARYQRMQGKKVLLLPGTDHAAVATQAKVEKILIKQGMSNPRAELGREKLLEKIREYAENSKTTILKQIKKMGTSCDWSRLAYTFDAERSRAVNEVFAKMYADGLIYRGYRVVNWSVAGQSTCSDDELVHIERPAKLYTFKYAKDFPISIATTRPETKLGDTAVAVNPQDKRYKKYIGKAFTVDVGAANPLEIKIIADENIDMEFGTGAVGVTPAHSMADFEMYEKQKAKGDPIGFVPVIDEQGCVNAGKNYAGLTVEKAREKFVDWLKENNLLEKEEEITHNVGTSDRFDDVVEVLPKIQWFVAVNKKIPGKEKSLKELMRDAVTIGHNGDPKQRITITPERFEKTYLSWIDNLHDWCISRQVWWGHQIPVWYKGEEIYCNINPPAGAGWTQDPDTLDTWFSSGLWTFSTLGWPSKTKDLENFHPTNWMQMGYELLFFWMARMILMSTYTLDQIPFRDVYIHGMLRNEKGKKFSKSDGNALDPLHIIEKYGTDALRLSVISGTTPGLDARFYEEKIEASRNFVNKLWNISRYILQKADNEGSIKTLEEINDEKLTLADRWILAILKDYTRIIRKDLDSFNFSQAEKTLNHFTHDILADWYIEISKFEDNKEEKNFILIHVLQNILKLWHPFIPFVTEVIWKEVDGKSLLIAEKWPDAHKEMPQEDFKLIDQFASLQVIIESIRNARAENKIEPGKKIRVIIDTKSAIQPLVGYNINNLIESQIHLIKSLRTGIDELEVKQDGKKVGNSIHRTVAGINIYIPMEGLIDVEKEKAKAEKELAVLEKHIAGLEGRLKNKSFVEKAPAEVVNKQKESLTKAQAKFAEIKKHLKELK